METLKDTFEHLKVKLNRLLPEFEIKLKAEIAFEINQLKKEKDAIILGHNYMEAALYHSVADVLGDSLYLSRVAAETNAGTIIFCGVEFMAETAKILNPTKNVLLPAKEAGCSLAASITADDVKALRAKYPGVPVITYINTYADVKAECDACCTSGNAAAVVNSFNEDTIIFLPDEYLAKNVARDTGKTIIIENPKTLKSESSSKLNIIGWEGRCEVHEKFTVSDVENAREQFPEVKILAHPECPPEVVEKVDFAASTQAMINYVKNTNAPQYLILTECAMGDNIIAENPDKEILRLCNVRCPHMNQITLEGVLNSLRNNVKEIHLEEELRKRALKSVQRMLEI